MADNVVVTAGTGTTIAADEVSDGDLGSVKVQYVKLMDGTLDGTAKALVDSSGLKVNLGSDNDVTVTNATATNLKAQAEVYQGGSAVASGNPLEVNVRSSTVGVATSAKQDTIIGHVDGIEGLLTTIDGDTSALAGAVSGSEMQVDIVSSALPSGASTSAKQDTQITAEQAIQTSVELIDDTVRAEDVASGDGHKGVVMMAVRQDTPANTSNTDGDYEMPKMSAGRLWTSSTVTNTVTVDGSGVTQPVSNAGLTELAAAINSNKVDVNIVSSDVATGGTSAADDADFTATTTTGTPAMGVYESSPTTVTDGDMGIVGITSGRRLKTSATIDAALPAGTNAIGKLAANSGVDIGDVDITSIAAGTNVIGKVRLVDSGGTEVTETTDHSMNVTIVADDVGIGGGTQYTEDAAAAANPVGNALMLVREDARAGSLTTTDGDNVAARGNNKGELYVKSTDSDALLTTIDADTGNISTKIDTLAGAVSGTEMQVDVLTLPNVTIGSAIPAGTNNIGDVDVLTVPADPFGANADAAATAGSTGSIQAKLRLMTSQLDSIKTAVETLDNTVGGSELQVDVLTMPTVTVTATNLDVQSGGADLATEATLSSVKTAVETIDNAISGSEMQVDVVGALPAGTNAIGKLAANSGVDIGDVTLTAGTAAIGTLLPPDIDVTTHTNYARKYYTSAGAATDGIIWSPAAGKRWHVVTMYINVSAAATVTLEDDKSGGDDPVWKGELAANSGVVLQFPEKYPMASGEDAADLLITTSAGNVYVTCVGYEI